MACSSKSLVFLVAALLLAALVAAAPATATAGGFQFQLQANGQFCGRVVACKEDLCSASCAVRGIAGVGQCTDVAGVPTCCCVVPTKPSAGVVHEIAH